jgi:hypothetical protein
LVAIANTNVVIPPTDIELRKECRSTTVHPREPIHEFANEGEWGGVSDGECVQFSVVLDGSEIAILLFDEEEGERVLRLRLSDVTFWEVLIDELLKRDVFSRRKWVHFAIQGVRGIGFQVNSVVPWTGLGESLSGVFAEDFCVCVVLWWDNLVPSSLGLICGLLC